MADQGGILAGVGRLPSCPVTTTSSSAANSAVAGMTKPVPMKLFSTWEVDKSTPSCIPRLCSLTLTRIVVLTQLENDLQSIIIAIKMQSSKRVLRSNEIILQPNGLLDTELDLSFALQYPHFLKRDGNRLQLMLQRRKKYKNRTILGYKTLAAGYVNMSQVLQHPSDVEMNLYSDAKEHSTVIANVMIMSLCSQPVDHDDRRHGASTDVYRSPAEMSDEDDIRDDPEFSSNDEMSDVEPLPGDDDRPNRARKLHSFGSTFTSRQRNLKQKFVALLRRFKVTDEVLESAVQDLSADHDSNPHYVDDLFEDVENLSESEPDIDTISVHSTPKPRLRPFFTGKGSSNSNLEGIRSRCLDTDRLSDDNNSRKTDSDSNPPQHILLDQLTAILSSDNYLPECIILINTNEWQGQLLGQTLQNAKYRTVCTCSAADVRAVITHIVNKIQKHCNKNNPSFLPMKIAVLGGDGYISSVLRPFVEIFSTKSPDWLNYLRFLIVPFGNCIIAKNLAALDAKYSSLFNDTFWKESVYDKTDNNTSIRFSQSIDMSEIASRLMRYISGANQLVQLPLAEAIVTNRDKGIDDCSQLIVPFIGEVRLGPIDAGLAGLMTSAGPSDLEDLSIASSGLSSSPPMSSHMINDKAKEMAIHSPTIAQNPTAPSHMTTISSPENTLNPIEAVDLQVDYWMVPPPKSDPTEKLDRSSKKELKCSLKTMFRSMQVFRPQIFPTGMIQQQQYPCTDASSTLHGLSMIVVTREKKQKIMRLGKKSKELDAAKSQQIDGISRMICTSKSQNHPLNVTIDGVDWSGVKFFQVSAQWQTHVKHFPVLVFASSAIVDVPT